MRSLVRRMMLQSMALLLAMGTGVVAASAQMSVEEKLAALESRIQQLESELAATKSSGISEVRVDQASLEASRALVEASGGMQQESLPFIRPAVLVSSAPARPASMPPAQAGGSMESRLEQVEASVGGMSFFRGLELTGLVDAYYGYDFNKPANRTADFRSFDPHHNSITLNLVELDLNKAVDESNPLGYRLTFGYGPTADSVNSFDPLPNTTTAANFFQYYLSGLVPVGKGLTVDVGKFVTQHGAEVIESHPNWNYTRGILFGFAIPFYHFGVRLSYPLSDTTSVAGFIVNGWNNVIDNNGAKTYGVQLAWSPTDRFSFVQNYMAGPEGTDDNDSWRHLIDSIVTVKLNEKVTFMSNFDYGHERIAGEQFHWIGTANYLRFQLSDHFAFTPRFEFYNDPQGFTTGERQQVKSLTFTPEFMITPNMITRLEYRRDWSNSDSFLRGGDSSGRSQDTATAGVMLTF